MRLTPEIRDQEGLIKVDFAGAMYADEITLEELLADEPAPGQAPTSFEQLLAEGFPRLGGLERLSAIANMADPGPHLAEVRRGYLQILALQTQRH